MSEMGPGRVKTRSGKGGAESFSQLPSSESSCHREPTLTSTESRWKFYTEVGHRSFHTAWAISERAYHLWIADGQREGQADIYWLNAQREILMTSVENSGSNADAAAPTDTRLVATKSAKKAKVARSGKNKTRAA